MSSECIRFQMAIVRKLHLENAFHFMRTVYAMNLLKKDNFNVTSEKSNYAISNHYKLILYYCSTKYGNIQYNSMWHKVQWSYK